MDCFIYILNLFIFLYLCVCKHVWKKRLIIVNFFFPVVFNILYCLYVFDYLSLLAYLYKIEEQFT